MARSLATPESAPSPGRAGRGRRCRRAVTHSAVARVMTERYAESLTPIAVGRAIENEPARHAGHRGKPSEPDAFDPVNEPLDHEVDEQATLVSRQLQSCLPGSRGPAPVSWRRRDSSMSTGRCVIKTTSLLFSNSVLDSGVIIPILTACASLPKFCRAGAHAPSERHAQKPTNR